MRWKKTATLPAVQQWADAVIFSSLFLAVCAAGMVYQTMLLFRLPVSVSLLLFTFCGTLCSYNFHWYFTPHSFGGSHKTVWSIRHKKVHALLAFVALLGALLSAWQLRAHWEWLLCTAFLTFLYSAPKIPHPVAGYLQRIAVGKTIFLSFAWAHVTALLPLLLKSTLLPDIAITFVLNRFFLIYAICILFDFRDREADREQGIRSLLTLLHPGGVAILFWCIMAAFAVSSFMLLLKWPLLLVSALALPGVILAFLYRYSLRHKSDYLFYFVLDGLMAVSVPLILLLHHYRLSGV